MALRFKLKDLAETVVEEIKCPNCGLISNDEQMFSTDHTRLTADGIVVIAECRCCGEVFLPHDQKNGILDSGTFRKVVEGEYSGALSAIPTRNSAKLEAERLTAIKRFGLH